MKPDVIIAAAGLSKRFKSETKKQLFHINGKPLIQRTIENFLDMDNIGKIITVISESEKHAFECVFKTMGFKPVIAIGGNKRADSVLSGLKQSKAKHVMIHDGARPFVGKALINELMESYRENAIIVPAVKPYETVRYREGDLNLLDRNNVYLIQTPQLTDRIQLTDAIERAHSKAQYFTDEAQYMQEFGYEIEIINGKRENIKITSIDDIAIAECITRRHL